MKMSRISIKHIKYMNYKDYKDYKNKKFKNLKTLLYNFYTYVSSWVMLCNCMPTCTRNDKIRTRNRKQIHSPAFVR